MADIPPPGRWTIPLLLLGFLVSLMALTGSDVLSFTVPLFLLGFFASLLGLTKTGLSRIPLWVWLGLVVLGVVLMMSGFLMRPVH